MNAPDSLIITHNAGFFSCCTIRLFKIIEYFNTYKVLPKTVNSEEQFNFYKNKTRNDITSNYFDMTAEQSIEFEDTITLTSDTSELQFSNYRNINFGKVKPFIEKYFSLSSTILTLIEKIKEQYSLDYRNLCSVYYRGTDKSRETNIGNFDEYIMKAEMIKMNNPTIEFLLMTDEPKYINIFKRRFPSTVVVSEVDTSDRFIHSLYLLAAVSIISKTKYIICGSGNVSNWIMFYRGNADNVYQYLNHKEYIYNVLNTHYDPLKRDFWLV